MANKNGRKGSEKHQEVQNQMLDLMRKEFSKQTEVLVDTEVVVQTPTSEVKNRIVDAGAFSWLRNSFKMKFHKIIQVGKTNKNGTPVAREQKAIEDIRVTAPKS